MSRSSETTVKGDGLECLGTFTIELVEMCLDAGFENRAPELRKGPIDITAAELAVFTFLRLVVGGLEAVLVGREGRALAEASSENLTT